MFTPNAKWICVWCERSLHLGSRRSLSPRLHRITFPDSGQNRGGKSHFWRCLERNNTKKVGEQLWTRVVFSCGAFVLDHPVKWETLETSLKEKQQQQRVKIHIGCNQEDLQPEREQPAQKRKQFGTFFFTGILIIQCFWTPYSFSNLGLNLKDFCIAFIVNTMNLQNNAQNCL